MEETVSPEVTEEKPEKKAPVRKTRSKISALHVKHSTPIPKASFFQTKAEDGAVLKGEVVAAKRDPELGDVMIVDVRGTWGMIPLAEADLESRTKSLVRFIGREITFVIQSYDPKTERLICSRKAAQEVLKGEMIGDLAKGKEFEATITGLTRFGAFVDVNGVAGILKNEDFSDDHISVGDVFNVGETLSVVLSRVNKAGKLSFRVPELYKKSAMPELSNFEVDQLIRGTIVSAKDWGFYVRLLPGVDALCPLPGDREIFPGEKAIIKLTQIHDADGNLRIRGKLIRLMEY